jgi:hypothetical protein
MIHPSTQLRYIDDHFGYGVFAVERIPRGTVVWAKDSFDQTFAPSQLDSLAKPQRRILEKYGFAAREGILVLCWDARRFLNHSCNPNLLMTRYGFEIAVTDIQPGDQLACDYGALNPKRPFSCHCGAAECRGIVHPEDAVLCAGDWSRKIGESLRLVKSVEQPLWTVIDGEGLLLSLAKETAPPIVPSAAPEWSESNVLLSA